MGLVQHFVSVRAAERELGAGSPELRLEFRSRNYSYLRGSSGSLPRY